MTLVEHETMMSLEPTGQEKHRHGWDRNKSVWFVYVHCSMSHNGGNKVNEGCSVVSVSSSPRPSKYDPGEIGQGRNSEKTGLRRHELKIFFNKCSSLIIFFCRRQRDFGRFFFINNR